MAKHLCKNGKFFQHSIDPLTHLRLNYSALCTKHLTGIEVSHSAIVRAAMGLYTKHLEELLDTDPSAPQRLLLGVNTREAIIGANGIPKGVLNNLSLSPFPKLSDLLRSTPENIWKGLHKTWFYQRGLKMQSLKDA